MSLTDNIWLKGDTAADSSIVDAGSYFAGSNVEDALQEAGADIVAIEADVTTLQSDVTTAEGDIVNVKTGVAIQDGAILYRHLSEDLKTLLGI